ncbi:MAG: tetratricopeptide repeat protein [Cyanobacteria bacterium P01_G01_bin.54]
MPAVHRDWVEYVKRKCQLSYKSQTELAEAARIHRGTVSNFLNGKTVSAENFQSLCDRLGLDKEREQLTQPQHSPDSTPPPEPPSSQRPTPTNLSRYRRSVPKFVGREGAMQTLSELLQQTETVAIAAAVSGMGGLGKTELAWQWAHQQYEAGTFPGGVVWLDMPAGNPGEQLVLFCQTEFVVELPELPTLEERVAYCWQHWQTWREGAVLVVLDDLAHERDAQKLAMLQPGSGAFRVLWTTRERWTGVRHYPLDQLSDKAARELLVSYIDPARLAAEPKAAKELLRWFAGLPLGLELAARYLALDEFLPIVDYLQELTLAHGSLDANPEMRYPHGVEAALMLSWRQLKSDAVRRLALRLGLYGAAPIPLTEAEQKDWREGLRRLVNLNLLAREAADVVRLHPLVRQFVRGRLMVELTPDEVEGLKREVAGAIVVQGEKIPEGFMAVRAQEFAPWIPHMKEVAIMLLPWVTDEQVVSPLSALDEYYCGQGLYGAAKLWSEQCVVVARERLGNQHPDTADALSNLAELYQEQGNYKEAESLYHEALGIIRQNLPPEHPNLAIHLNNLAGLYRAQESYTAAESLYIEAVDIDRQSLSPDHPDLAIHLNNLAGLYRAQGKYGDAERLYREALDIKRENLPPNHPSLATSLNNLACLYNSQEKFDPALPLHKEAVEIGRQGLDCNHPNLALFEINLARCYQNLACYAEAEPLMLKGVQVLFDTLGEDHPETQKRWNYCLDFYRVALAAGLPDTGLGQHPLGDLIRSGLEP